MTPFRRTYSARSPHRYMLLFGILCSVWIYITLCADTALAQQPPNVIAPPTPGFQPLAGIPGVTAQTSISALLNSLYKLSIIVGALLAVVMIALGGFQYMSPTVGGKEAGLARIKAALFGLLILLTTALILKTIFGQVDINVLNLSNVNAVTAPQQQPAGAGAGNTAQPASRVTENDCTPARKTTMNCQGNTTPTWNTTSATCSCQ